MMIEDVWSGLTTAGWAGEELGESDCLGYVQLYADCFRDRYRE